MTIVLVGIKKILYGFFKLPIATYGYLEASKPKWVNSVLNTIGVNSHGGLYY